MFNFKFYKFKKNRYFRVTNIFGSNMGFTPKFICYFAANFKLGCNLAASIKYGC